MPTTTSDLPLRRIIICADDFGMNSGIDEGILELARSGHLSAVSCLTQGPGLGRHASSLATLPVDIGVHLNFTESLGNNQLFLPLPRLIAACYGRRLPASMVVSEIHAQLDAFETSFGRAPDFIDGHQHVHQFPVIRENLLNIIGLRYPGQGLWLRSTQAARPSSADRPHQLKRHIISILGARRMRSLADARGLAMNRHLLGVYDFSASPERYQGLLMAWLAHAEDGDLLMCHPAKAADAGDPIGQQRTREFCVLADSRFPAWLLQHGLKCFRLSAPQTTGSSDLPASGHQP